MTGETYSWLVRVCWLTGRTSHCRTVTVLGADWPSASAAAIEGLRRPTRSRFSAAALGRPLPVTVA